MNRIVDALLVALTLLTIFGYGILVVILT